MNKKLLICAMFFLVATGRSVIASEHCGWLETTTSQGPLLSSQPTSLDSVKHFFQAIEQHSGGSGPVEWGPKGYASLLIASASDRDGSVRVWNQRDESCLLTSFPPTLIRSLASVISSKIVRLPSIASRCWST